MSDFKTQAEFAAFHAGLAAEGVSPEGVLLGVKEPRRMPGGVPDPEASLESLFAERLPRLAGDLAGHQRSGPRTAEMAERLFREALERRLSRETLAWLGQEGYSLGWLFFGQGQMRSEGYRPAQPLPDGGQGGGADGPLGPGEIRLMRAMAPGWSGADWAWLHGGRYMRREKRVPPSLAIAARAVACWSIPPFMPEPPSCAGAFAAVQETARRIPRSRFGQGDWRTGVIRLLQRSPARAGLLVGVSLQAAGACLAGRSLPADPALKALLLLVQILGRWQERGLLDFLDMLNDEARSRGFEDLGEVFRRRSWGWTSRSPRKGPGAGAEADRNRDGDPDRNQEKGQDRE